MTNGQAQAVDISAERKARMIGGYDLPKHVPNFLPDGIYFGMEDDKYHANAALGSTDMKKLARNPASFWFESRFNPLLEDDDTAAKKFGRACHKAILEGREAFHASYGMTTESGTTKAGKTQKELILAAGKEAIKQADFERIEIMAQMIRSNKYLSAAFAGGLRSKLGSEVSIFWTSPAGIRKKCRIDKLKIRANVDLKTLSNKFDDEFLVACRKQISNYRYDVQAAHYAEGRAQLMRLVAGDPTFAIYGADDDIDFDLLRDIAQAQEYAFVYIFVQSKGAPLTWGSTISCYLDEEGIPQSKNGIFDIGRQTIMLAEDNWRLFLKRFGGLDTPWVLEEPITELSIDDFPTWSFR